MVDIAEITTQSDESRHRSALFAQTLKYKSQLLARARRLSLNQVDAEDAFQQTLTILHRRAIDIDPEYLFPWLSTVIKNEARGLKKQRLTEVNDRDPLELQSCAVETQLGLDSCLTLTEAAGEIPHLKAQEKRCLLLQASGYSYSQISELTGYSWTKVNRCVSEGRSALRPDN